MGAESTIGRVQVNARGFGFVKVPRGQIAFVAPPDLNPFLDGDEVEARIETADDGRQSAHDLRLLRRDRAEVFGRVVFRGKKPFLKLDREIANTDWPLRDVPAAWLEAGAALVATVEGDGVRPTERVEEGDVGLTRVRIRHGIRDRFLDYAPPSSPSFAGRRDLRGLVTVTIDAPTSMDLDDALTVLPAQPDGGVRVLVSIADVDALVPKGAPLDVEARARGTSVYLAGAVTPMLPRDLSEDRLSLLPGQDRAALTCELRVDPDGAVTAVDLYESLLRSTTRLDYAAVGAFLDGRADHGVPDEVQECLRWLRTAASRLAVARRARGGVQLAREEAYLTLDAASGEPTDVRSRADTSAHRLVERLMVAANEAVGRWLHERGLPALYRVHPAPDLAQIEALEASAVRLGFTPGLGGRLTPRGLAALEAQYLGTSKESAMQQVVGRVLGPARYTVEPGAHFGLGAPLYVHFTSPIRRYADLAVHRIVKRHLGGSRDQVAEDPALAALATHLDDRARRAAKAEAERQRMLAARLFAQRVGERYRGHVVAVKAFGLVVALEGTGVSGTVAQDDLPGGRARVDLVRQAIVTPSRTYTLGQPLSVEVRGAREDLGRIELAVLDA